DAALVHLAAVLGADAVDHAGGVEGANDLARPLLSFQQPLEDDREDFVGVDEAAVFGDGAKPVSVAVGGEAGGAFLAHNGLLQQLDMRRNWLRIDAGKKRV